MNVKHCYFKEITRSGKVLGPTVKPLFQDNVI
jgi:hypothetical protein